jgi:hypothetical protein
VLIPTGLQMRGVFDDSGLARCLAGLGSSDLVPTRTAHSCDPLADRFQTRFGGWLLPGSLLLALPLLLGLFLGAPLVSREVEQGTHRLVWTQGVSRRRWAAVKFGFVAAVGVAFAVGFTLLVTWWFEPLSRIHPGRFDVPMFDLRGTAPIGYALFAVALGVFAGAFGRAVLPAMAATLGVFVAARFAVAGWLRPRFQEPLERRFSIVSDRIPNPAVADWNLSQGVYDRAGTLIARDAVVMCPASEAQACGPADRMNVWVYQPGDRYWLFQYAETGLFVAVAALLLILAYRRVTRHIT